MQNKHLFLFILLFTLLGRLSAQTISLDSVSTYTSCDGQMDVYYSVSPANAFSPACYFEVTGWGGTLGGGFLAAGASQGVIHLTNMYGGSGDIDIHATCNNTYSNQVFVAVGLTSAWIDVSDGNSDPLMPGEGVCLGEALHLALNTQQNVTSPLDMTWSVLGTAVSTTITGNWVAFVYSPLDTNTYTLSTQFAGVSCPALLDTITIPAYPPVYANLLTPDTSICNGKDTVALAVQLTGGTNKYHIEWWLTGPSLVLDFDKASTAIVGFGANTITLVVEDSIRGLNCPISYNKQAVDINISPPMSFHPIFQPMAICQGQSAHINLSSATGGGSNIYFTATPSINFANGLVSPNVTTTYQLTMIDWNGACPSITDTASVHVYATPSFNVVNTNGLLYCSATGVTYQWFLNNSLISGATQQTYQMTQNGNYFVIITTPEGCSVSSQVTVGIEEAQTFSSIISPNPVQDRLYIDCTQFISESVKISISDISGKTIFTQNNLILTNNSVISVPFTYIPSGLYFILIETNGIQYVQKIVKQ